MDNTPQEVVANTDSTSTNIVPGDSSKKTMKIVAALVALVVVVAVASGLSVYALTKKDDKNEDTKVEASPTPTVSPTTTTAPTSAPEDELMTFKDSNYPDVSMQYKKSWTMSKKTVNTKVDNTTTTTGNSFTFEKKGFKLTIEMVPFTVGGWGPMSCYKASEYNLEKLDNGWFRFVFKGKTGYTKNVEQDRADIDQTLEASMADLPKDQYKNYTICASFEDPSAGRLTSSTYKTPESFKDFYDKETLGALVKISVTVGTDKATLEELDDMIVSFKN